MILLLAFLFGAMAISFLCSTLESSLLSTPLSYILMKEEEGDKTATLFKKYKTETERPLAAILSLNTIANTIGAAGVGQQATTVFGSQWFGLVSAIMTLLILIFSEIIPKTIGTTHWRSLMGFTSKTSRILLVLMFPLVKLVEWVSRLINHGEPEAAVSREEVLAMANVGEEEGVIEEDENKVIQNIIKLDNVTASDVMTPRVVAAIAPESMTLREYYDDDQYDHFSRIPVYAESPEYITGYVLRDDALENLAEDKFEVKLGEIKRELPYFNEEKSPWRTSSRPSSVLRLSTKATRSRTCSSTPASVGSSVRSGSSRCSCSCRCTTSPSPKPNPSPKKISFPWYVCPSYSGPFSKSAPSPLGAVMR